MRITLTDIRLTAAQDLCVGFCCAFGEGRGQWLGPSIILLSLRGGPERLPQWVSLRAHQISLQPIAL
ncbi:hypothetical protein RZO07_11695 [Pseudomonas protegens]|uniref:hypothetical protein n=1 Tax=Pseudomonas protegens TaxID=380021 RepID=UPI002936E8FA|nr:hypothetical protein [Pseudomonas protegens]WOE81842.1 hypothetical protein RZO07_11695 [Pseudomonas protegens]